MIRRVVIRPEAKQDLRDAKEWYQSITVELGAGFGRRFEEALALVQEHPLAFRTVFRTFRRVLFHQFPYAIFYHAGKESIVVVAVLHQARDLELLRQRKT